MNKLVNEDEFFNLKLPLIEKIEVTEKEFETIAKKIPKQEYYSRKSQSEMREDFLNFVVFGKTPYYYVPSKKETNDK